MSAHDPGDTRSEPTRYRGPDRRAALMRIPDFPVRRATVALAGVAAAWLGLVAATPEGALGGPGHPFPLVSVDIGAAILALLAGGACMLRWRVEGRAPVWWLGLSVLALGAPGFAGTDPGNAYVALGVACTTVAVGLFLVGCTGPAVDTGLAPVRSTLSALAVGAVAFVMATVVVLDVGAELAAHLVLAGLLLACAALADRRFPHDAWIGAVFVGFALAEIVVASCPAAHPLRLAGGALLHLVATGMAVVGATAQLHAVTSAHRAAALRSEQERADAEGRRRELEQAYADTMHEVRSTVVALEGGMRTLEPAAVPPDDQQVLARALLAETRRLRALVDTSREPTASRPFRVVEVLEPLLTVSVAGGWPVSWDIPADLAGLGHPAETAQIAHALLTNARRHAPGSPIEVGAVRQDGFVLLRVDDRGPGVVRGERELIFERSRRGANAGDDDGRGLGLHIARRIAREQGGDLWVEPRAGGGASFVLAVPALAAVMLPGRPSVAGARLPPAGHEAGAR